MITQLILVFIDFPIKFHWRNSDGNLYDNQVYDHKIDLNGMADERSESYITIKLLLK